MQSKGTVNITVATHRRQEGRKSLIKPDGECKRKKENKLGEKND